MMFRFLFGKREAVPEVRPETQRETLERALAEVNEIVGGLDPKPRISFDPVTGTVNFELPEQFPDEARALPAPPPVAVADEAPAVDALPTEVPTENPAPVMNPVMDPAPEPGETKNRDQAS